jgi:regulator of sigma E protease
VKMLDEREGPVAPAERHLAFNTQPLRSRAAIVAAGPAANLLLAVLLYAAVNWIGMNEPRAVLVSPPAGSMAADAGLRGGELVERGSFDGEPMEPLESFDELRWLLTQGALDGRDVRLAAGGREAVLPLSKLQFREADEKLFNTIGITAPRTSPVIGEVKAGGAAERAGLRQGDRVLAIDGLAVVDGRHLREQIKASVAGAQGAEKTWRLRRDGSELELKVRPDAIDAGGTKVGRIEAFVGSPDDLVEVRHGPLEGLWRGAVRTSEMSLFTLRMLGKMVTLQLSWKNLSGPLTIAEYAGKSASVGLTYYLLFLAMLSVSLGVLNLLPVPVLDGGHLMYYLWEAVTGRGVSDVWLERLQRGGIAVLMVMMSVAIFNDVARQVARFFS